MYVVTNRKLNPNKQGLDVFGFRPNERGPNELRLVNVEKSGNSWTSDVLLDQLKRDELLALRDEFHLPFKLNEGKKWYAQFARSM